MGMFDTDPTKPYAELLGNVQQAVHQSHVPGLPLLPLATLLVKVSTETSETIADLKRHITDLNKKNGILQGWVVALAVAALLATIVQTSVAVFSYQSSPRVSSLTAAGAAVGPLSAASAAPKAAK